VEGAKNFYNRVFGWTADTRTMGTMPYTMFMMAGETVAGMMEMGSQFPAGVPAHWLVYLGTADLEATIAQARGLGARQLYGPMIVPDMGRFSVFNDPQGAPFAAWQQA
jgi:hypothetical protein